MKNLKKTIVITATSACILALLSCGSASNNDQGVSFSSNGWAAVKDGACTFQGITEFQAPISLGTGSEVTGSGLIDSRQCMVVENRMTSQFIRADRIYYTFNIPGASVQPPNTSMPFSAFLAQVPTTTGTDTGSGSGTDLGDAQRLSSGAYIVPPQIFEWISLNRDSLPSIPFQLEVYARVSGVTAAGDRLQTNEIGMPVFITQDEVIAPSPGPTDAAPTPVDETSSSSSTSL